MFPGVSVFHFVFFAEFSLRELFEVERFSYIAMACDVELV